MLNLTTLPRLAKLRSLPADIAETAKYSGLPRMQTVVAEIAGRDCRPRLPTDIALSGEIAGIVA